MTDLYYKGDGKKVVTFETEDTVEEIYDRFNGEDVDIQIRDFKRKRSLDANGYAWVLIGRLASRLGLTKTEVYRMAIREVGGASDVICLQNRAVEAFTQNWTAHGIGWQCETIPSKIDGCTNVVVYYGSSSFDTKQMSDLIEALIDECKAHGIDTMPKTKLTKLLNEWEDKE